MNRAVDPKAVLIVGASGVGKDTLLSRAQERLTNDARFQFIRREITRPADPDGENHIPVSESFFDQRLQAHQYKLWWGAHGLRYGIVQDAFNPSKDRKVVVFNASRSIVAHTQGVLDAVHVIEITVCQRLLRDRLLSRGRETPVQIEARLRRVDEFRGCREGWVQLDNSGDIEDATQGLTRKLIAIAEAP